MKCWITTKTQLSKYQVRGCLLNVEEELDDELVDEEYPLDYLNIDYDNLYQHDYYGSIFNVGTESIGTGYFANIYDRDVNNKKRIDKTEQMF